MRDLAPFLKCRNDGRPRLMGIVNVTPDSFHANSRVSSIEDAVQRAILMWEDGADWVDIGGESTRPGSKPVDVNEEMERVVPVIKALREAKPFGLISVDTRRVEVASAALEAGADMINDVSGLRNKEMFDLVIHSVSPVCIMHMQGEPGNMQNNPHYEDVVSEVSQNLLGTADRLIREGHPPELIILDPGIGFGKNLKQNLELLSNSSNLGSRGRFPILWGVSRKSLFDDLLNREKSENRLSGTLGVAAYAYRKGIDILRVHDVAEHNDLLKVITQLEALENE